MSIHSSGHTLAHTPQYNFTDWSEHSVALAKGLMAWQDQAWWTTRPHHGGVNHIPPNLFLKVANKERLADHTKEFVAGCQEMNPEFDVHIYDAVEAETSVGSLAPALLAMWPYLEPVERADLWRYLILYSSGGVYLDSDVQCVLPFREWNHPFQHPARVLVGIEAINAPNCYQPVQFCQYTFAAAPGHPLFARVIDYIVAKFLLDRRWEGGAEQPSPLLSTGPFIWTEAIIEYLWEQGLTSLDVANVPFKIDDVGFLPMTAFAHTGVGEREDLWPEGRQYVKHYFKGTWRPEGDPLRQGNPA
ncbi:hypothetical protein WJX72_012061 [[Myrmecia] bisecta]|uniref:Initiation-specific alpha-1,6-mannosyltransferase n=1 Tax=[Myrmecia] bisecta TaxID=41462 RepID=A0AAW1PQZ6_9CHLO